MLQNEKALELHNKALKIRIAVHGEKLAQFCLNCCLIAVFA